MSAVPRTLALLLLALAACRTAEEAGSAALLEAPAAWDGAVQRWGTLREALHHGRTEARVELAELARPGVHGVGALEGLRGEVTIVDGEVWTSEARASGGPPVTRRGDGASRERATVLFAAEVPAWREVRVREPVAAEELEGFLAASARAAGLDPSRPFPFVVEGPLFDLELHVVAGECPVRARALGAEPTSPPFELRAEETAGRLVGLYAEDAGGELVHMGARSHVHAVLADGGELTGHVDAVGLGAGAVLRLPRK